MFLESRFGSFESGASLDLLSGWKLLHLLVDCLQIAQKASVFAVPGVGSCWPGLTGRGLSLLGRDVLAPLAASIFYQASLGVNRIPTMLSLSFE